MRGCTTLTAITRMTVSTSPMTVLIRVLMATPRTLLFCRRICRSSAIPRSSWTSRVGVRDTRSATRLSKVKPTFSRIPDRAVPPMSWNAKDRLRAAAMMTAATITWVAA